MNRITGFRALVQRNTETSSADLLSGIWVLLVLFPLIHLSLPMVLSFPETAATAASGKPVMVRVAVWDDTDKKPVDEKAEIWFRGYGSWWLKPELKYGGTFKNLGRRPSGEKQVLNIL